MRRLSVLIVLALALMLSATAAAYALPPEVTSFMVNSGNTATNDRSVSAQITSPDASEMRFSVDTGDWSEWGPYADTTSVVLPDVEGEHTVYGEFRNVALEVTARNDSIVLDRVVPHATLHTDPAAGPAAGWYKSLPVFWFTAEEPVGVFYYWDALPWTAFYPGSETTSPTALAAPAVLSYYAMDFATNAESVITTSFNVDETSPTVDAVGLPASGQWSKSDITVGLTANDTGGSGTAGVSSIFGDVEKPGTPRVLTTEGIHPFEYWALDGAGNESNHTTVDVKIDKTAPTASASEPPAGWVSHDVVVDLSAADAGGSGVKSINSPAGEVSGASSSVTVAAEGDNAVEYWSTDNAGNESNRATVHVKIDKTPPATVSNGAASYERGASFTLAPADSLSGVASTQWRVDGGTWQSGTQVTISTLGKHTVEYRSTDNAGNAETPKSANVRVYSRANASPIPLAAAPSYGSTATVVFQLLDSAGNPVEAGETVTCSRVDGTWSTTVPTVGDGLVAVKAGGLTSARAYSVTLNASDKYEPCSATYTFLPKLRFSTGSAFKTIYKNRTYTAFGYLTPKHTKANAKVRIHIYKRGANKKYKLYKTYTTSYSSVKGYAAWSRFSAKVVIKSKGRYKLIAHHLADSANAETWGSWDYFTVK